MEQLKKKFLPNEIIDKIIIHTNDFNLAIQLQRNYIIKKYIIKNFIHGTEHVKMII
jgi:hypothetical protein